MILLIDNYDSFTYNLMQYFAVLGEKIKVVKNDKISLEDIKKIDPEIIVISPGPGKPKDAGISLKIVEKLKSKYPIFGVCLGHQIIANAFGADIVRAKEIMHGKTSFIKNIGKGVFKGLEEKFKVARYHSLIIDEKTLSDEFEITAKTEKNEIMGIRHKKYMIEGVQFHPEAILSENGLLILSNFLKEVRGII